MSTTILTTPIPLGTYAADPVLSHVGFAVRHMVVATFRGGFKDVEASLTCDEGGIRLDGAVPVASIAVDSEDMRAHLLSADFFDVAHSPRITFAAGDVRIGDDGSIDADGELTIRGITRPVRVSGRVAGPVSDPWGMERLGLDLEATIDRTAYGVSWNLPLAGGGLTISRDVRLTASLSLVREGA